MRRDVEVGHPDFGKAFPCRCVTENPALREERRRERIATSGLPPALYDCTLDSFRPVPALQAAVAAVREAIQVQVTGGDPLWVVLFGSPGVGKTHLLAAAANALLARQRVVYWPLPAMLEACKARGWVGGEHQPFAEEAVIIATAKQADVLLLDEVGGPDLSRDYGWSKLDLILKHRYERRAPLFMALTCDADALAQQAPAITSRLKDRSLVRVVNIEAADFRPQLRRETA